MDIFQRIQDTLENKLLRKYLIACIVLSFVAWAGLSLVTSTFNPALVNAAGAYIGSPLLLVVGCIATVIGVGGAFYFFEKWRSGSAIDRGETVLTQEMDALRPVIIDHTTSSRTSVALNKLNMPGHDEYFYTSVVRHLIHTEYQSMAGEGDPLALRFITQLSTLATSNAYIAGNIANPEQKAIAWASAFEKEGTANIQPPALADFTAFIRTI